MAKILPRRACVGLLLGLLTATTAVAGDVCCTGGACVTGYVDSHVALVIGNDRYETERSGILPLTNAGRDARLLSDALIARGFSVRCVIDATAPTIQEELRGLGTHMKAEYARAPLNPAGRIAIVYYAGHGFSDGRAEYILAKPEACTAPDECSPVVIDEIQVSLGFIRDLLESSSGAAMHNFGNLLIIDACRNTLESLPEAWRAGRQHYDARPERGDCNVQQRLNSTTGGAPAYDDASTIGDRANGFFAGRFGRIVGIGGLTFEDTIKVSSRLMGIIEARPGRVQELSVCGLLAPSISDHVHEETDACKGIRRDFIAASFVGCGRGLGDCKPQFCSQYLKQRSAEISECLRPFVTGVLPIADSFCAAVPASMLQVPRVAFGNENDLRRGWITAMTTASRQLRQQEIAQTRVVDENLAQDATARSEILRRSQSIADGLLKPTINPQTRGPFSISATEGVGIPIKVAPNAGSATKRFAEPGQNVVADCLSQACPPGWLGVRVTAEGKVFRGWIPVQDALDNARSSTSANVMSVSYAARSNRLDISDAGRVAAAIRGGSGIAVANVMLMQPRQSDIDDLLAEARVALLQELLADAGVPLQNIHVSIATGADAPADKATIELRFDQR